MSDLHSLPLLLPQMPWSKSRAYVYRSRNGRWYWQHACYREMLGSGPWACWEDAFGHALTHVRECWSASTVVAIRYRGVGGP